MDSTDLDLGFNSGSFFGVLADNGEGTSSLAVETHVLGERLGEEDVVAIVNELSDGEGILVDGTGSESLNFSFKI